MNAERQKAWGTVAVVGILIALIAVGLRYSLTSRHFGQTAINNPNALPNGVGVRLVKSEFIGYDSQTRKVWTVRADHVDISSDKMHIQANGHVEARIWDAVTGKQRIFVTAPIAVFTGVTKTLQVGGKIICHAPGNDAIHDLRVEAETLVWNVGAKQITCSGAVHADLPNNTGTADGRNLTLNLTTREWVMSKFHGAFVVREGAGTTPPPFVNPLKGLAF